ncbi:MAG: exodeoxyribonuclease III [Methylotetracoccus sp.]|nr:exodeoxyribonuclease III [Methylotetracoccus sp.]
MRLPQLEKWLGEHRPEVVALQETKVMDEDFPVDALASQGYHCVFSGQKTYNGVALLSRIPLEHGLTAPPDWVDPQRRVIAATVGTTRIVNLYVPNGSEVGSEKYRYKLEWLERMADFLSAELANWPELVVLGDFNIAPEDRDVYDPEAWREKILCSTTEREAFRRLLDLGLSDAFRLFEQPAGSYTWWDYRTTAFRRNHGLRIDHILVSESMRQRLRECRIDLEPRKQERPSDHTPIVAVFS